MTWVIHSVPLPKTQGMSAVVTGLTEWVKAVYTWVHTFSSGTYGLGVESTPRQVWGYTLSLRWSDQGQCLTCPVQYTPSALTHQVGARPLPESRQTLKWCATTLPVVCHFHLRLWTNNLTHQGTGDQVLCVLAKLNTPGHLQWWSLTPYTHESNRVYV
jgi:hypothetical protein